MMGARGRVPSRARRPARRPAWAPLHVPSRVGGRPRRTPSSPPSAATLPSEPPPIELGAAGPNPSSIRSFRRRMHARRGEALRSGHARPERGGASRRGPLALALRCLARSLGAARMGERAGGAHGRVALRSEGLFMCPCWLGKVHLHVLWSGLPSRRRSPSPARGPPLQVQSLAMPCVVLAEPGWIQSHSGPWSGRQAHTEAAQGPGSYLICT